jgi:lipopolysaccharide transport system permease protein
MSSQVTQKEIHILPSKKADVLNLAELWQYRDLLELLVKRDIAVKYRQTVLGPLWLVVQPLALTLVFSGVFGAVGNFPTDGVPPPLFYLAGLVPWAYFSLVFGQVAGSLHGNVHLFSKVYFPRLIIPLSSLASGLIALGIQFLCFALARLYYAAATPHEIPWGGAMTFLLLPFALLLVMAFTFAAGLWMAVLTARYRDLTQVAPFLIQILMYVTPLIYPLSSVPEKFKLLASLNPLTVVLEAFRQAAFGGAGLPAVPVIAAVASTAILLLSGLRAFSIVERNVVDSI